MQRTVVTPADRERFLERARALRDHFTGCQCRYWVFEEMELPGAFIAFAEASDPAKLADALAGATELIVDPTRIYREVPL